MKKNRNTHWMVVPLIVIFSLACNLSTTSPNATEPPVDNPPAQIQPSPTTDAPLEPTATTAVSTNAPQPTATTGPQCTSLQNLNLRSGPGLAYRDPIDTLSEKTILVPLAYNPVGIPGGSWVMVQTSNGQNGWVNAASQYVSCNLDLTKLAPLAVEPPPAPTPPKVVSSAIDGFCFPGSGTFYDCEVKVSNNGIIQVKLKLNGQDAGKEDGIDNVSFTVFADDGTEVYSTVEKNAPYCIFGDSGGECNSWLIEDYVYKWYSGGDPLQEGHYKVSVQVNLLNDPLGIHWEADYDVNFP